MPQNEIVKYKIEPWPYQDEAINKGLELIEKNNCLGLLIEMRLGKTMISIHISEHLKAKGLIDSMLVIAPSALTSVWQDEIPKHSYLDYTMLTWDARKAKNKSFQKEASNFLYNKDKFKILLVNIEALQNQNQDLKLLLNAFISSHKPICILDESSKIKTHDSNRTINTVEYTKDIPYKVILTGTELTEGLLDIYPQFIFLKYNFWNYLNFKFSGRGSAKFYYLFRSRYAILKTIQTNSRSFQKVVGFKLQDELISKINPYCIRLKKVDVFKDLPEQIEQIIRVDMNTEQRRVYDQLKKQLWVEYQNKLLTTKNKISLFTRSRQITSGFFPETEELIGGSCEKLKVILEDSETYKDQIVIVSCFTADIKYIYNELSNLFGPETVKMFTGEQDKQEKADNLKVFQTDKSVKYFLLNPKTGSYGIDLQNSSLVYFFNRSLSTEENIQLMARVHGPLQKKNVLYKDIVMNNSIDEKIIALIKKKIELVKEFQSLAENAEKHKEKSFDEMSIEEVLNLL